MSRRTFLKTAGLLGGATLLGPRVLRLSPQPVAAAPLDVSRVSAVLRAGGGTVGGIGYIHVTGVSKVVADTYPRVRITVVPGGWIGNLHRTEKREMDLASTTVIMSQLAAKQRGPFTEPFANVRSLLAVQDQYWFVAVVRKDFPAETVGDVVRKRVPARLGTLAKGNATEWIWRSAFEEIGATWDDFPKWGGAVSHAAWADLANNVRDGHLDGILAVVFGKIGWLTELSTARDIRFLRWDPDIKEKLIKSYGFADTAMPAGLFRGQPEPVPAPTDGGIVVIHKEVPDDIAYAITKAVAENEEKYRTFHAAFENFKAPMMARNVGAFPLHEGAAMYYRERGWL